MQVISFVSVYMFAAEFIAMTSLAEPSNALQI